MAVSRETWHEISAGVRDMAPVGFGLIPMGLAFGLLMSQSGFAWWWTPIFSIVVYAGSAEFLVNSMVLNGVGPVSSLLTGLMVNFRHVFYGLTFPRDLIHSRLGRVYSTYALTDETYAVASAMHPDTGVRLLSSQIACQILWVVPGILGALVGGVIPPEVKGMDFALTALFIVLAYEAFQASRDISAVLIAGALGLIAAFIAPDQMLVIALIAYFGILLIRFHVPRLDAALRWRL